jgi:hypothetical protein
LSLLLNFLLFVVANGFLGDLVEKTKDDSGEHEPERDEGILGVAELDFLGELGKVLETEWGRCSKKCFLFRMVNFTVLSEPGKVLEILLIVDTVDLTVLSKPGKVLKANEFTQHATWGGSSSVSHGNHLLSKLSCNNWTNALLNKTRNNLGSLGGLLRFCSLGHILDLWSLDSSSSHNLSSSCWWNTHGSKGVSGNTTNGSLGSGDYNQWLGEVLKIFFATVTFIYMLADDLFGMVVVMVLFVFILLWNFGFSSSVLLKSFGMLHFGSFLDVLESVFLLGLKNLSFSSGVLLKSDLLFVVAVRLVGLSDNLSNLLDVVAVRSGSNLFVVVAVGSGSEVHWGDSTKKTAVTVMNLTI